MTTSTREKDISFAIIIAAVLISVFITGQASAQTDSSSADTATMSISFPVAELGNCKSKADCKSYCDRPGNTEACIAFAEKNGLMPKEEIETARKFLAAGGKGPGGCTGKDSCEAYCNDINNMDACVAFAEQSGIMPPKELDEAKKVQAAIKRGVKPPACNGKKACDAYCEEPNHIEECVSFAAEAGFMSPEEQANAQKMVQAIKSGVKPLPCKGKEECDAYCGQEQNFDACVVFAEAAGFMSKDDATMAKKTRGKGPGGCQGKEACDAFCDNPDNQQTCFNFGKENGLIPPEELRKMEEGDRKFRDSLSNTPPEIAACLENALGKDNIDKLKSGAMRPTRDMGDKMAKCFRQAEEERIKQEDQNGESSRGPNRGPEDFASERPGEQGEFRERGPREIPEGALMDDRVEFSPNKPDDSEEQRPDNFEGKRPPSGPNYRPGPEGSPCEGENCPFVNSQSPQIKQMQRGEIQPMQQYKAPNGTGYPPSGNTGGNTKTQGAESIPPPPPPPPGGDISPVQPTAPAPMQEPVPASAPTPTSLISPNSMTAAVIYLLRPLLLNQK